MSEHERHGGVNIEVGIGIHGRHHNRFDPITQEARQIATQMDLARNEREAQMAAERLRIEVSQIRNPHEQRRLVEEVDRFDRKGVGADLYLGTRGGQYDLWSEVSVTPPCLPTYRQGNFPNPGYGPVPPPYYGRPGNYPNPGYEPVPPPYYPENYPTGSVPPYFPQRPGVSIGAEIRTHGFSIDLGIFKR